MTCSTVGTTGCPGRRAWVRDRVLLTADRGIIREEDARVAPPQYVRRVTRRNWAFDLGVALVVGALGQLEVWWGIGSTHLQGPTWVQAVLYAVTAALLVWRRVHPLAVLAGIVLVSAVEFAVVGSPEGDGVLLPTAVAVYTVARREEPRRSWWGLVLGAVYWLAWSTLDPTQQTATLTERALVLVWFAPFVIAWLVGALVRMTALYIEQRQLTSELLTQIYLRRIDQFDPKIRCVITVTRELALSQARKADSVRNKPTPCPPY